jgi:methylglyoxal synthase
MESFLDDRKISMSTNIAMVQKKKIGLVAHDYKKAELLEWARYNREILAQHTLYATGTTGRMLSNALNLNITCLQSGPLGGDQQIGAKIVENEIDMLIFFWDPLQSQSHDPDIKALLRVAAVWNIPLASNHATADFMISSPLMSSEYQRVVTDYTDYKNRSVIG